MQTFIAAHDVENSENKKEAKIAAILEAVFITFLITLIPHLIELGRPPTSLMEIWVPLLSSALMGIYIWIRMRGIEVE